MKLTLLKYTKVILKNKTPTQCDYTLILLRTTCKIAWLINNEIALKVQNPCSLCVAIMKVGGNN